MAEEVLTERDLAALNEQFEQWKHAHERAEDLAEEHRREFKRDLESQRADLARIDDKRAATQNEWRGAMDDRERNFATKPGLEGLAQTVQVIKDSLAGLASAAEVKALFDKVALLAPSTELKALADKVALLALAADLKAVVNEFTTFKEDQARSQGRQQVGMFIMAAIPTVLAVAAFIIVLINLARG